MSTEFINNDYTISFYSSSSDEIVTSYPSSSTVENILTQSVTQSVLNNYTWSEASGSTYSDWTIVSGTAAIGVLNPNSADGSTYDSMIGARLEIRGNEIYTTVFRGHPGEEDNGIAIYSSASSGWSLKDYVNIPTSSIANPSDASDVAREFSLDQNYMIVPATDISSQEDSRLFIFKSGSSGWAQEQVLTTASYDAGASVALNQGRYAFLSPKIKGDTIFANGFKSGYYNAFVAFFKSSSAGGWAFEKEVQVADSDDTGIASAAMAVGVSGVATDFDGTTAVIGAKHGESGHSYHQAAGRIKVLTSSSAGGWVKSADLGLLGLGLTSDVSSIYGTNYTSEYRTYDRFGYKACSISGSYIAAAAQGKNIYSSVDSKYHRQKHSVFIMKSGSTGYVIDARLDDPATNLVMTGTGWGGTTDSRFGEGIRLNENVLVVSSPTWESEWGTAPVEGRYYVYVSSSAGGWTLNQTISNPYSGSVFQTNGSSGDNMQMGYAVGGYSNAGSLSFGVRPAISGSILALGAPYNSRYPDPNGATTISSSPLVMADAIYGAFYPLSGSGSFVDHEYETYNTESVTSTVYVTQSGGPVPFRFAQRGGFNLRDQKPQSSYKTFIGEQKT